MIPFSEIDRAIRINSAIDERAPKTLSFKKWQGMNNSGLGRCIFIFVATKVGYTPEEICDYLAINMAEFNHKTREVDDLYATGRKLFEDKTHRSGYTETREPYLAFYRKLLLVQNYLRYRFDYTI
jgi:hypothetical protein